MTKTRTVEVRNSAPDINVQWDEGEKFVSVAALIYAYFDGLYTCDLEIFKAVFHPKATYATADETPLLHRNMDEYFDVIAARQSPASKGEARRDVIDEIQFAGENTAFARVRCSIGATDFVDFLTLVRVDGHWQIMAKIFHIIPRS
ncbi:nuclear transport factor 2 family protein [Maritalea porphyrae]|uniref:nuclear transport factor 2 family protein n=1 Tax=Maritalea porphyrae TaxID=880732 RepID=UPI0022AF7205|nr:nuclear transport factor 2 family protein [Maritalea porphyrae]MCZ4273698.1 nuclear transport factor 2 family protein [Maritalea porphyrae]